MAKAWLDVISPAEALLDTGWVLPVVLILVVVVVVAVLVGRR